MSEARKSKQERRAVPKEQQNYTIISEDGGRKVLSYEEYQEHLNPSPEGV